MTTSDQVSLVIVTDVAFTLIDRFVHGIDIVSPTSSHADPSHIAICHGHDTTVIIAQSLALPVGIAV
jgi:hypothetical protein